MTKIGKIDKQRCWMTEWRRLNEECSEGCYDDEFDEDYMPDEYVGTYAHDVAGMSDDDIDAASMVTLSLLEHRLSCSRPRLGRVV